MNAIRRINDLGRIAIPKEIRREARITESDLLDVSFHRGEDGTPHIVLTPYACTDQRISPQAQARAVKTLKDAFPHAYVAYATKYCPPSFIYGDPRQEAFFNRAIGIPTTMVETFSDESSTVPMAAAINVPLIDPDSGEAFASLYMYIPTLIDDDAFLKSATRAVSLYADGMMAML